MDRHIQAIPKGKITANDICRMLGIGRSELFRWTHSFPPFSCWPSKERIAQRYTAHDLVFFKAIYYLNKEIGIKTKTISEFSEVLYEQIHQSLDTPIFLTHAPNGSWQAVSKFADHPTVISITARRLADEVNSFLAMPDHATNEAQRIECSVH